MASSRIITVQVDRDQPRWNHETDQWDPPGTKIEILEEDYPLYAAHCFIVPDEPKKPGAGETLLQPVKELVKKISPSPTKKPAQKGKK